MLMSSAEHVRARRAVALPLYASSRAEPAGSKTQLQKPRPHVLHFFPCFGRARLTRPRPVSRAQRACACACLFCRALLFGRRQC